MRPARTSSISAPKAAARPPSRSGAWPDSNGLDAAQQNPRRQTLKRLPAIEIVAVVAGEDDQILLGEVVVNSHRRGKAAQKRQGGPLGNVAKHDRPPGVVEFEDAACELVGARVRRRERQVAAVGTDQAEREWHRHRQLDGLPWRRRKRLRDVEPVGLGGRIVGAANRDSRRARLAIPTHELGEIASRNSLETTDEILDCRRVAVVAGEIKIHAGAKRLGADQALQHAHDLGAFLIDGRGVEIADLVIDLGAHIMRQRAGVLGELRRAQRAHVADALNRRASACQRKIPGRGRRSGPPSRQSWNQSRQVTRSPVQL